MKVVAVTQRVDHFADRNEIRDALDQRLITFLFEAGFIPVPLPNRLYKALPNDTCEHEGLDVWLAVIKPHAFVLSGGNDIGQCRERDLTEGLILDYACQHKMPLLGICRGMQMMAHWAGAELCSVQGHIRTKHRVTGEISGDVNSYHGFSVATCPLEFDVLAKSEDGEIEAIHHHSLPWEGWMWHPEREAPFDERDIERLRSLFG
jgi:gamma-glutamyl-gamma-aminobutyrate hydrolase PuuD